MGFYPGIEEQIQKRLQEEAIKRLEEENARLRRELGPNHPLTHPAANTAAK